MVVAVSLLLHRFWGAFFLVATLAIWVLKSEVLSKEEEESASRNAVSSRACGCSPLWGEIKAAYVALWQVGRTRVPASYRVPESCTHACECACMYVLMVARVICFSSGWGLMQHCTCMAVCMQLPAQAALWEVTIFWHEILNTHMCLCMCVCVCREGCKWFVRCI